MIKPLALKKRRGWHKQREAFTQEWVKIVQRVMLMLELELSVLNRASKIQFRCHRVLVKTGIIYYSDCC